MPRKKKPQITVAIAISTSIKCFIEEMSKHDVNKPVGFAFAIINDNDIRVKEVDVVSLPTKQHVADTIAHGLNNIKAKFVVFTIWNPNLNESIQSLNIITYSKKEKHIHKSPFKIVNNKLVPVEKQEKGFYVFMEDENE